MSQPKAQVRLTSIEQVRVHAQYQQALAIRKIREAKVASLETYEQGVIWKEWNDLLNLIGEEDDQ